MISEQVILDCQAYNQSAQMELYRSFSEMVMVVCKRYSSSQSQAEDMFQDAFLHIFKNIAKFDLSRGIETFPAWLRRVVANVALGQLRLEKKHISADIEETEESIDDNISIEEDFDSSKIFEYLEQLPTMHKAVFNLYAIEGYNHNEIGDVLGISPSNSRSYLSRARKKLSIIVKEIGVVE